MGDVPSEKFPPLGALIRGLCGGRHSYGIVIDHRHVGEEWHFRCFWSDDGKSDTFFWSPVRFRLAFKHPWEVIALLNTPLVAE